MTVGNLTVWRSRQKHLVGTDRTVARKAGERAGARTYRQGDVQVVPAFARRRENGVGVWFSFEVENVAELGYDLFFDVVADGDPLRALTEIRDFAKDFVTTLTGRS